MKWRGIDAIYRQLVNHPWILGLLIIVNVLAYFTGIRKSIAQLLALFNIESQWAVDLVTFALSLLAIVIILSLIGYFLERRSRRRLRIYTRSVESVLWRDASGERISEFQKLRSNANNSILVMGIGLTFFSNDLSYLKTLLEREVTVRILMIDPDIISQDRNNPEYGHSIVIESGLLNDYFVRPEYDADIRSSFNRLRGFISDRKRTKDKKGQAILKKYRYFIPMNVTMIDESDQSEHGRMLLEWCLPFSDWRITSELSRSGQREFFDTHTASIEELWHRSKIVMDDSYDEKT